MFRFAMRFALVASALSHPREFRPRAPYSYPGGYGAGEGGAGRVDRAGEHRHGMGNFAAGAGAYNEQTAQARSMNAKTAMQVNEYMYAVNQRNAANEMARLSKRRGGRSTRRPTDTYKRLHDNPDPHDIHTGDALNVVLTELANPKVYTQVVQKATRRSTASSSRTSTSSTPPT